MKVAGSRWFWFALGLCSGAVATSAAFTPALVEPDSPPVVQVCRECDEIAGCPCCVCVEEDECGELDARRGR
jgi:hypothetical protein